MKVILLLLMFSSAFAGVDERAKNLVPLNDFFGKHYEAGKGLNRATFTAKVRKGVDHRNRDTPIKSQWNGTCTAFSGVAGIENLLGGEVDLSERDAWSKYQEYSVYAFVDSLKQDRNVICDESSWPQDFEVEQLPCKDNRKWRLDETTYLGNNIDKALDALDSGSVVYMGLNTPVDMLNCEKYINPETEFSNGGHAILVVGYDSDNNFIIKNSWGEDCGDFGYQYLPFSVCERSDGYCVMWDFKSAKVIGPTYKTVKVCKRLWWTLWIKKKCEWVKVGI